MNVRRPGLIALPPETRPPDPTPSRAGRSRQIDKPEPGFFQIRMVKGGPWVPARIIHDAGDWWTEIDGKRVGVPTLTPDIDPHVNRVWQFGREITEAEYRRLLARPASARPDPYKAIDLRNKGSIY